MSNYFFNLPHVVLNFFRRRPPIPEYEIPDFLRPPYLPAEPGKYGGSPFNGAIKFICTNGDVWVFPDGRVIDLRVNTSPSSDTCDQGRLGPLSARGRLDRRFAGFRLNGRQPAAQLGRFLA